MTTGAIPSYLYLLRAKDTMDRDFAQPLDVPTLARAAYASSAHFIRAFKRAFGETPHAYLVRRRVERAKDLLRETDLPVTRVAFAVGFRSPGSFSTTFRELVGVAPREYRAEARPQRAIPGCFALMWTRPLA